ncbi:hypothetical protein [Vagococcus penaei]|nr:hypothetical protein [Vagococcus penaei]
MFQLLFPYDQQKVADLLSEYKKFIQEYEIDYQKIINLEIVQLL